MDPVLPLLYDVETPAGQGITVEIYGTVLEQMTVNRLYYFCPEATALTPTQLGQFSASVWNGIGTEWAAAVSDQWGLQEVRSYAHRDYAMMFGTRSAPDLIDTVGTQGGTARPHTRHIRSGGRQRSRAGTAGGSSASRV